MFSLARAFLSLLNLQIDRQAQPSHHPHSAVSAPCKRASEDHDEAQRARTYPQQHMTDLQRIELAIRRTSDRLKQHVPWDMAVTNALDGLADELASLIPNDDDDVLE